MLCSTQPASWTFGVRILLSLQPDDALSESSTLSLFLYRFRTVKAMDTCFNFECQFRDDSARYTTCFRTSDKTEWRLIEKWRKSKDNKVGMQQRLIFRKVNHYLNHYDIQVDILPKKHKVPRFIRCSKRAKAIKTVITISLLDLQVLAYSTSEKSMVAGVEINVGALTDVLRYKVTVRRAYEQLLLPRLDNWKIFSDQMRSLLQTKLFADSTIVCDGHYFKIHKCILACQSSLFYATFTREMAHKYVLDGVEVKDIPVKMMKKVLFFVYGGLFAPRDAVQSVFMYEVGYKFEMEYFKDICRSAIEETISPSIAVSVLYIAHINEDPRLEEICKSAIAKDYELVTSSNPMWKDLIRKHPGILSDTLAIRRALVSAGRSGETRSVPSAGGSNPYKRKLTRFT